MLIPYARSCMTILALISLLTSACNAGVTVTVPEPTAGGSESGAQTTGVDTTTFGGSIGESIGSSDGGIAECIPPLEYTCAAPSYPITEGALVRLFGFVFEEEVIVSLGETCCGPPFNYHPGGHPESPFPDPQIIEARLYRPDIEEPQPLPMVIFAKATGAADNGSPTLFELLARNGYLVLDLGAANVSSLTCAVRWLQTSEETAAYSSCDVVFMGQSRGGFEAWEAGRERSGFPQFWNDAQLRAIVLLAAGTGMPMLPFDAGDEVPLVTFSGTTDEELGGRSLYWYELMYGEPANVPMNRGKLLVWAYNFGHFDWGGYGALGEVVAAYYINAFLDREVAHLHEIDDWQALTTETFNSATLNVGLGVNGEWNDVPGFTAYSGNFDCRTLEDDQIECEQTIGCYWAVAPVELCANRPMIFTAYTPSVGSPGSDDLRSVVEDFEGDPPELEYLDGIGSGQVQVDAVFELIDEFTTPELSPNSANFHFTQAMRVLFDGEEDTGAVRVELQYPIPVEVFTHLTYRAGNLLWMESTTPQDCSAFSQEPLSLHVELVPAQEDGVSVTFDMPPLVQQHYAFTEDSQGVERCNHAVMLQTIRHRLAEACELEPAFGGQLEAVVFHFPEQSFNVPNPPGAVGAIIDSIELTSTPEDVALAGTCDNTPSAWDCRATSTLTVRETACTTEPIPGCTTTQTPVPLPEVSEITSGTYEGWIVHVPWVDDPNNPTNDELKKIADRCVTACLQQWSDDPDVQANCEETGTFEMPTLRTVPSIGTVRPIPFQQRKGGGIFTDEELDCDITSTCALAFDERLAMAPAQRPTPAEVALHLGEEYVFTLDTSDSELIVEANETVDSMPLQGEIGFSLCPGSNDDDPCPFYLGSVEVQSIGSIIVPVTCPGGGPFNVTLSDLELHLGQPAFGISSEDSELVGFPKGSLVFDATFEVANQTMAVRGTTQIDIVLEASPNGFEALEIPVIGNVTPCMNDGHIEAEGTFDIVLKITAGPVEAPPSVEIDIPSTVTCNTPVELDASVTDPDDDLSSVRWYVDDQLIAASTTSLTFTQGHDVRVVARDVRGAATTATKTISCVQ